jgi:hypothetical protein
MWSYGYVVLVTLFQVADCICISNMSEQCSIKFRAHLHGAKRMDVPEAEHFCHATVHVGNKSGQLKAGLLLMVTPSLARSVSLTAVLPESHPATHFAGQPSAALDTIEHVHTAAAAQCTLCCHPAFTCTNCFHHCRITLNLDRQRV